MLSKSDLLKTIEAKSVELGLAVRLAGDELSAEIESIRAKWFLGGRKAIYRMSCMLDEAEHRVLYREAVIEKSWGIPPPTLTVETTTVKGWKRSGARTDASVGGGGTVDYGKVRDALEQLSINAGWQFHLEGGRMP